MAKNLNRNASRLYPWPLLFNIFINDLFLFIQTSTLCNYVDGNYMYSSVKNANVVISKPRQDFPTISEWFYKNCMALNEDKCHFLVIGFNELFSDFFQRYYNWYDCNDKIIIENILVIVLDIKLILKSYLKYICKKG